MRPILTACLPLLLIPLTSPPVMAGIYENSQYRFTVVVPDVGRLCVDSPPAPDHGFRYFPKDQSCNDIGTGTVIRVVAEYNAANEFQSLTDFVEKECGAGGSMETDITIPELSLLQCKPINLSERVTFKLLGLRKTNGSFAGQWILFVFELEASPAELVEAREVFSTMVRSVRLN